MQSGAVMDQRRSQRIFCGMPMEFDGYAGNAIEISEATASLVLQCTDGFVKGHRGILKVTPPLLDMIAERCEVVRVTRTGVVVTSLESSSMLPVLMELSTHGVQYIEHRSSETLAMCQGELSCNCIGDFKQIYVHQAKRRKYILDFRNVVHVAPSGLAMLLQLAIYNSGDKTDVVIVCTPPIYAQLASLDTPGIGLTLLQDHDTGVRDDEAVAGDADREFRITVTMIKSGQAHVTVRMPAIFDYTGRFEFAKIYVDRPAGTTYDLDFTRTVFFGKSAYGTLLLLKRHIIDAGDRSEKPVRLLHCNSQIRDALYNMGFNRHFAIG
jgi:anti-anti-sigma regulatory factor